MKFIKSFNEKEFKPKKTLSKRYGMDEQLKNILDINNIIEHMQQTTEDSWCVDVVKSKDQNCFFGHLFDYAGGDDGRGSVALDMFESMYATMFMVYPVNDGKNPDYIQHTPKQRVVAYLEDLRDGKQKTTYQLMEEYDKI